MLKNKLSDFVVRILQNRLMLFGILLGIQSLFFVTNGLNSILRDPDDGWELKIEFVDQHLTPQPLWLIPYAIGFFAATVVPLWAAHVMPIRIYRQFILSMMFAAVVSYVIYMTLPTYVVKPDPDTVPGDYILATMMRTAYEVDNGISTHNAAPSQHVFYALINMCFMIRFRPRMRVFWVWVTLGALISASALLTRQHHSPDLIAGYLMTLVAYPAGLWLGNQVTDRLHDEHSPKVAPTRHLIARRRTVNAEVDPA